MSGHRTATEAQKALLLLLLGHIRQPPLLNGAHAVHPALGHGGLYQRLELPPTKPTGSHRLLYQLKRQGQPRYPSALKSKPEFL